MSDFTISNFGFDNIPQGELVGVKLPKPPNKRKFTMLKRLLGALKRTIAGENKTGEAIHGVLDLFPIPNQAIAKLVRAIFDGDKREAKEQLNKAITPRNIVALVGSILYLTGIIGIEDLKALAQFISEIL